MKQDETNETLVIFCAERSGVIHRQRGLVLKNKLSVLKLSRTPYGEEFHMWWTLLLRYIVAPIVVWIVRMIIERLMEIDDPKVREEKEKRLKSILERIKANDGKASSEDQKKLRELLCELRGRCERKS